MAKATEIKKKEKEIKLVKAVLTAMGINLNDATSELFIDVVDTVREDGDKVSIGKVNEMKEAYEAQLEKDKSAEQQQPQGPRAVK